MNPEEREQWVSLLVQHALRRIASGEQEKPREAVEAVADSASKDFGPGIMADAEMHVERMCEEVKNELFGTSDSGNADPSENV